MGRGEDQPLLIRIKPESVARVRSGWMALYSGELYHSLALAMLSNLMTITPMGAQLPSMASMSLPPL